jgi:TonB family protein
LAYRSEDWTEPVHWLTNQATLPGLSAPGDSPAVSRSARVEKPGARVTEAAPPPLPVPGRSTLLLHGAIARRSLRSAPELPSIAHSNLLEDTVVRAGVQADGHVFSAAIARSSRLKAADDRALEIARSARFEPEPGAARTSGASALSWGELVFRWHVIPGTAGARP